MDELDDLGNDSGVVELRLSSVSITEYTREIVKRVKTYSSGITKLILLAGKNLSQDAAHNLATAGLGKIRHDEDNLGRRKGTDALTHLEDELLAEGIRRLSVALERDESVDGLASELIGNTNDGSLSDGTVRQKSGLDLSSGQTVTANVDNVIDTAADPVETLVVTAGTITGEVVALVHVEVRVHVALVVAPDGASHAGPGALEAQNTIDIVAVLLLAADGVDNCGLDTEEWERGRAGLGGGDTSKRGDAVSTGLGLPVRIADVGLLLADNLIVPLPDLSSNGLTDGAKDSKVLHLVAHVLVTSALQQAQSGGSDVELSDLVLLNDVPVAGEVGVGGSTLENESRDTEKERRIDDVAVAGNPADITTAEKSVSIMNVEDVLAGKADTEQETGGGVHDALRLAGGTGGVEEEQGVLRVDSNRRQVVGVLLNLLVPPEITARGHGDLGTGALVDKHALDVGALLKRIVDNLLGANELAATLALVRGDEGLAAGVQAAVAQRVGRETGENNGVDGANSGAGKEGDKSLGNHGHVDGDGITLLDAHRPEDSSDSANLAEELAISDIASLTGLVGLVDDSDPVGVLESMSVDAVV